MNKKIKKYIKTGISFLIMAAAVIYSGYHLRWPTNAPAMTSFMADLTSDGDHTVVIDLGSQSWPKYLLQPGRVSVRGQLNAIGDLADSQTRLLITMESSSRKISARPSARNMTAIDNGYSYEVSLNSTPKPKQGREPGFKPKPDRNGQDQDQMQDNQGQEQGLNPKQNPNQAQDQESDPKPKPNSKPNQKPKPNRRQMRGPQPGTVPLSFELTIPYLNTIKHDIGTVVVKYTDSEQGSLQGKVTFLIRNSRIGAKQ